MAGARREASFFFLSSCIKVSHDGVNARVRIRRSCIHIRDVHRHIPPPSRGERGGNSSLNAHLGKGVAFATVVDSAATTPESTHPCVFTGVKGGEKRERRWKGEREEGRRVKEKPEDSQLSTLSDDNIIVGGDVVPRPLYQELFPATSARNENKRW